MAGDWIKMRVWLRRDPRVASMADFLSTQRAFMGWLSDPVQRTCNESAYEHITSDVTRAITVVSLLEVWGVAREQGDRDGDDLVLKHCDLSNLDDVCGTPRIGEAMDYVGWAIEEQAADGKGRSYQQVRFPKFFRENESPDDRYRKQHAEAQARYRAKHPTQSDITVTSPGDVTVTPREEKRREEKSTTSLRSVGARPTRLPETWEPSIADVAFAKERLRADRVLPEVESFRNYWRGAVKNATSPDWSAKWRTWVLKASSQFHVPAPGGPRRVVA